MNELEQKCIDAGLKMTGQRRVILEVLGNADDHPSVETVYLRSREKDTSISIATVYRTLNLLDQMNLVKKHDFNENHARFEANLENHYHFIDVQSGEVVEFKDEKLEQRLRELARELGFELVDRRVELYGHKKQQGTDDD
ncbi:Fur family transcriptional regulator [Ferruginivarius sediminum]|jgi:Fur family ferric uptake transcriptional regulator|uniref:Ferric uptake regulation protein n=1 Tax=Ferruginivarius sediminum TaxID=2661937 RepID=A0A369TAK1_9PROT|nr:Fur family transcriptional regulator [Ferruginivarius sediminum]RDD61207.1 transcriptional repressor [Ferruginivarius sediminum]